jgi:hypothetical protein
MVVITSIAYVLASSGETPLSLAFASLSVFIGTVALMAAVYQTRHLRTQAAALHDQVTRFEATEKGLAQIAQNMAELSDNTVAAIKLPQTTAHVQGLLPRVRDLTEGLAEILPADRPFISEYIDNRLTSLIVDAERANSGSLEIAVVDLTDFAITLFELAKPDESVYTTSYVDTEAFWHTPAANNYLQTNKRLIRDSNVKITRIFIFDDAEALKESEPEMDKQCAAKINVKTVLTSELQGDLKRDMFLLGDRLAAQFEMTTDRHDFQQLRVYYDDREVAAFARRMERLDEVSTDYSPAAHPASGTAPDHGSSVTTGVLEN